jgi:mannose/cellobiose epimerase-like protein (N-acyl-D-glucosamine 2-epimerase family)
VAVGRSFLAGGIIMSVLKEELPAERQSRFWPFALSAALYGVLLLAL